jgi:malonyl-CoA decarboxylase
VATHPTFERAPTLDYKTEGASAEAPVVSYATRVDTCVARCRELLSERGHAPGSQLARDVLVAYRSLDPIGRNQFFDALAQEFAVVSDVLCRAASDYLRDPSDALFQQLRRTTEAPRQELFRRLNAAPGGTALLVDMRHHLLDGLESYPAWTLVETDLREVLTSLFNRGLLEFQQIDCETPSCVLEKLFEHEAVHAIHDWKDLGRRLEADRRCYALFHPAWPEEPLIFAELALTRRISTSLEPLLNPDAPVVDPDTCRCAIFYSISNCQRGLRGFAFGSTLIGRAIEVLRMQLPRLGTYATLSPIPGFRAWLSHLASQSSRGSGEAAAVLARVAAPGWHADPGAVAELKDTLVPLCVSYLLHVKLGNEPADPVARFHLGNGARLQRVNWFSDISPRGLDRSLGLTANYLYRPAKMSSNCEAYRTAGRVDTTRQLERMSNRVDRAIVKMTR